MNITIDTVELMMGQARMDEIEAENEAAIAHNLKACATGHMVEAERLDDNGICERCRENK